MLLIFFLFLSPLLHARLFLLFPPHFLSFLHFLFLFFFFTFFLFFSFFFSYFISFSPYPPNFYLIWLDLRKFPPYFSSLFHGHVSSYGPSIMCHVSRCEPCAMCHMDTCFRWHLSHHMALMPCVFLLWCHVAALGHAMWHHPMCHLIPGASKNVKFRPSRNSMKFY